MNRPAVACSVCSLQAAGDASTDGILQAYWLSLQAPTYRDYTSSHCILFNRTWVALMECKGVSDLVSVYGFYSYIWDAVELVIGLNSMSCI